METMLKVLVVAFIFAVFGIVYFYGLKQTKILVKQQNKRIDNLLLDIKFLRDESGFMQSHSAISNNKLNAYLINLNQAQSLLLSSKHLLIMQKPLYVNPLISDAERVIVRVQRFFNDAFATNTTA